MDIVTEFAVSWIDVWRGQQPPSSIFVRGGSAGADRVNAETPDFFSTGERFVVMLGRYERLGPDGLIVADAFLEQDGEALVPDRYQSPPGARERAGSFSGREPNRPSRLVATADLREAARGA